MDLLLWSVVLIGGFMLGELSVVLFLNWRDCGDALGREKRQTVFPKPTLPKTSEGIKTGKSYGYRDLYEMGVITLNEARGLH